MQLIGKVNGVKIESNGRDIFLTDPDDENLVLRISPRFKEFAVTCADGEFTPWSINGLPAFCIKSWHSIAETLGTNSASRKR